MRLRAPFIICACALSFVFATGCMPDPGLGNGTVDPFAAEPTPPTVEDIIRSEFAARGADPGVQNQAIEIARCESSLRPEVVSRGNWGLFQINWTAQQRRVTAMGFAQHQLTDPTVNSRVAAEIWTSLGHRFGTTAGWSCARILGIH